MALSTVASFINGIFALVTGGVNTFLTLNFYFAQVNFSSPRFVRLVL